MWNVYILFWNNLSRVSIDILIAKSVIDGIVCFIMATTLGIGCAFSAFFVLLYQGLISLVGWGLIAVLPEASIAYMSATGSLVILLVGTNVLGCTNIKTANMIPAIFMPAIIWPLLSLILWFFRIFSYINIYVSASWDFPRGAFFAFLLENNCRASG